LFFIKLLGLHFLHIRARAEQLLDFQLQLHDAKQSFQICSSHLAKIRILEKEFWWGSLYLPFLSWEVLGNPIIAIKTFFFQLFLIFRNTQFWFIIEKNKKIQVAKWGTPKKNFFKNMADQKQLDQKECGALYLFIANFFCYTNYWWR